MPPRPGSQTPAERRRSPLPPCWPALPVGTGRHPEHAPRPAVETLFIAQSGVTRRRHGSRFSLDPEPRAPLPCARRCRRPKGGSSPPPFPPSQRGSGRRPAAGSAAVYDRHTSARVLNSETAGPWLTQDGPPLTHPRGKRVFSRAFPNAPLLPLLAALPGRHLVGTRRRRATCVRIDRLRAICGSIRGRREWRGHGEARSQLPPRGPPPPSTPPGPRGTARAPLPPRSPPSWRRDSGWARP